MFNRRVPFFYLPLTALLMGCLLFFAFREMPKPVPTVLAPAPAKTMTTATPACAMVSRRITGYNGIKPLLFADPACEAQALSGLKADIASTVEGFKNVGTITSASVYVRHFLHSEWTSYNVDEEFEPGSLMKVPLMMAYLRMAETDPAILDRSYALGQAQMAMPHPYFPPASTIVAGKAYTVRQLLQAAIERSDNLAVVVLMQHVDQHAFHNAFTELGLSDFKNGDKHYPITARDYSAFIKSLYNATYLGIHYSEFAMSMMLSADFKQGIRSGVPDNIQMAHKFGESGDGQEFQLHESGIVYLDKDPYLITVMTKGPDMTKLPEVLSAISAVAYHDLSKQ